MGQSCVRDNDDGSDAAGDRRQGSSSGTTTTKGKGARYHQAGGDGDASAKKKGAWGGGNGGGGGGGGGSSGGGGGGGTVRLIPLEHMEHPQSRLVAPTLLDKQFREFSRVAKADSALLAVAAVRGVPGRQHELLCAGEDRALTLLNFSTGHILQRWDQAHDRDINALSSPHPTSLAFLTASRDKLVKVWQLGKDDPAQVFRGHTLNVTSVDMSTDGTQAVSGSRDNTVRLWDIETGAMRSCVDIKLNLVHFVKFLPQQHLVAQGGEDLTVRLYDVRSADEMTLQHTLMGFDYHPICADVARNGSTVFTGHNGFNGQGSMVVEWDLRMLKQVRSLTGHQFTVRALKVLKSDHAEALGLRDQVFSASDDGTVRLWNTRATSWTDETAAVDDADAPAGTDSTDAHPRGTPGDGGDDDADAAGSDATRAADAGKAADAVSSVRVKVPATRGSGAGVPAGPSAAAASTLLSSHEVPEGKATAMDESEEGHILMALRNGCLLILRPQGTAEQVALVQRFRYVGNPAAN